MKSGARAAVDTTRTVTAKVSDPSFTASVSAKVGNVTKSVQNTVTDPELLQNVQKSAGSAVSSLWGGLRGLASTASVFASQLVGPEDGSAMGRPGQYAQRFEGDEEEGRERRGGAQAGRAQAGGTVSSSDFESSGSARRPSGDGGGQELDNDAWLAQQVSEASKKLQVGGGGKAAGGSTGAAAGWDVEWKDEEDSSAPAPAKSSPQPSAGQEAGAGRGVRAASGAGSGSPSAPAPAPVAAPVESDDDFFSKFGIK